MCATCVQQLATGKEHPVSRRMRLVVAATSHREGVSLNRNRWARMKKYQPNQHTEARRKGNQDMHRDLTFRVSRLSSRLAKRDRESLKSRVPEASTTNQASNLSSGYPDHPEVQKKSRRLPTTVQRNAKIVRFLLGKLSE